MKKKKPIILDVFGMPYEIIFVKDLEENEKAHGIFCEREMTIKIDADIEGDVYLTTLLHELGHALFNRLGWKQGIDESLEEVIVDSVATFIVENFDIKLK